MMRKGCIPTSFLCKNTTMHATQAWNTDQGTYTLKYLSYLPCRLALPTRHPDR